MKYWIRSNDKLVGVHVEGKDWNVRELAESLDMDVSTLRKRAKRGWSVEDALSVKVSHVNRKYAIGEVRNDINDVVSVIKMSWRMK